MPYRCLSLVVVAALVACSGDEADGGGAGGATGSATVTTGAASGVSTSSGAAAPGSASGGRGGDGGGGVGGDGVSVSGHGGAGPSGTGGSEPSGTGGVGAGSTEGACPSDDECPTAHCTEICGARIAIGEPFAAGDLPSRMIPRRLPSARAGDFVIRAEEGDAVLRDPTSGVVRGSIEGAWLARPSLAIEAMLVGQLWIDGYASTSFFDASDPAAIVPVATWYPAGSTQSAIQIFDTWNGLAVARAGGQVALVDVTDPTDPFEVACFPVGAWHPGYSVPIGVVADHLVVQTFGEATFFHRLTADEPEEVVLTIEHPEIEEPPVLDGDRILVSDAFKHVRLYEVDPVEGPSLVVERTLDAPLTFDGPVFGGFAAVDFAFPDDVVTWVDLRDDLALYDGPYYEAETGPCVVPLRALEGTEDAAIQPWFDPTQRYPSDPVDRGCESAPEPSPLGWSPRPTPDPDVALIENEAGSVAFDLVTLETSSISLPGGELGGVAAWLSPDDVAPSGAIVRVHHVGGDWFESHFTVVDLASEERGETAAFGRLVATVATPEALWALVDRDATEWMDPIDTPRLLVRVTSGGLETFDLPEGATSEALAVFGDRVYVVDALAGRVDVFDTTPQLLRSVAWPGPDEWSKHAAGVPGLIARDATGRLGLLAPDADSVVVTEGCEQVMPVSALGAGFLAMRRSPEGTTFAPRWSAEAIGVDTSGAMLALVSGPSFPVGSPSAAAALGSRSVVLPIMQVVDPID